METLYLVKLHDGKLQLRDGKSYPIGFFPNVESTAQWCKENDYNMRNNTQLPPTQYVRRIVC